MDVKITIITVILHYSNQITKKLCIVKQEIMCAVKIYLIILQKGKLFK